MTPPRQSRPHGGHHAHHAQATTPTAAVPEPEYVEGPWGEMENESLREAVEQFQGHPIRTHIESSHKDKEICLKWSEIAGHCQALGCRRSAKQCRERYINHMAPGRRDKILPEEGQHIMELVAFHGQKWAFIGRELNRPENTVKNYWNQERKKRENGRRRASSNSHQADAGRQHAARAHSYSYVSREYPHSRRESMSSIPGLVSDHGSPVESSPRSSRHNSFGPVQQLPLPPFQGWKPTPASPLQPGYQMDRTQALSSTSSAYSAGFPHSQGSSPIHEHFYQHGHPVASHQPEANGYFDRRAQQQQQQQHSVSAGHDSADNGFESSRLASGYTQGRDFLGSNTHAAQPRLSVHANTHSVPHAEAHQQQAREQQARDQYYGSRVAQHARPYSCTATEQSSAAPHTNMPYRTQRETLPPVSAILNSTVNHHLISQRPFAEASSRETRSVPGHSGEMKLRHILN